MNTFGHIIATSHDLTLFQKVAKEGKSLISGGQLLM